MIRSLVFCIAVSALTLGCARQEMVQTGPGKSYQVERIGSHQSNIQWVNISKSAGGIEVSGVLRNTTVGNAWPGGKIKVTIIAPDGKEVAQAATADFHQRGTKKRTDRAVSFRLLLPQLPESATIRVEHILS